MPTLITDYFAVAQSGPTADGRNITAQSLLDIAETYSVSKYLAKIWPEHLRWRPMGEVAEVRATTDKSSGIVTLENRVTPYDDLLYYVRKGVMTQPSIEIMPDFAKSGKAYQFGLGATDAPASLGTDKIPLMFNTTEYQQRMELYRQRVASEANCPPDQIQIYHCPTTWADVEFKKQGTKIFDLGRVFRSTSPTQPSDTHEDIDMTKDELKEVLQGFKTELKTELKQEFSTQPPAAGQGSDQPATVTLEQYNALKQEHDGLKAQFKKFEEFMAQDVTPERKELGGSTADDVWDWK